MSAGSNLFEKEIDFILRASDNLVRKYPLTGEDVGRVLHAMAGAAKNGLSVDRMIQRLLFPASELAGGEVKP